MEQTVSTPHVTWVDVSFDSTPIIIAGWSEQSGTSHVWSFIIENGEVKHNYCDVASYVSYDTSTNIMRLYCGHMGGSTKLYYVY